jgi:hypothetical protein
MVYGQQALMLAVHLLLQLILQMVRLFFLNDRIV